MFDLCDFRPRVHAQRKFAQGQGSATSSPAKSTEVPRSVVASSSGRSRAQAQAALELQHQSHSSSSSTASGPTSAHDPHAAAASAGERPKTEDFLTFLCLRGTNLLPPELDFFNKASVVPQNNESSDDISSDDDKASLFLMHSFTVGIHPLRLYRAQVLTFERRIREHPIVSKTVAL